MGYADKLGIPFVLLLGEDELKAGSVSVKNMRTGTQETVPLGEAAAWLRNALAPLSAGAPVREPQAAEG